MCEPQRLTEDGIKKHLLDFLDVQSYRITNQSSEGYEAFFKGNLRYDKGQKGFLWVRAHKPAYTQQGYSAISK